MKIAAITFGTEGDARPMAALCRGLADVGHDTCFLTEKSGVRLATSAAVQAIALAGDIKTAMAVVVVP